MPKYVVFMIVANRPEVDETRDKDDKDVSDDPLFKEMLRRFLSWIEAEIKSERLKDGAFVLKSSEETNIRVEFHEGKMKESETGDSKSEIPPPDPSVTHGLQSNMSTNIMGYYTAEFPTVEDVVAWARSCPVSFEGFALEVRQLQDSGAAISEAPSDVKEWAGDQILSTRKQLLQQGKMKKDEEGTLWVKVEEDPKIKKVVAEAEERQGINESERGLANL